MSGSKVTVKGVADVNRILRQIAPAEAKNLLRATAADLAKAVADGARQHSSDDTGRLDKAITSKRQRGSATVIAAAAVVKGAAFYWRFREYGQGPDHKADAMFLKSVQALKPQLNELYLKVFGQKLEKRLQRLAKKTGV